MWMKSGALWVHCWGLALASFGRDPHSSESWRVTRNFIFCQLNNARFYRFPSAKFHKIWTLCRSVKRRILSESFSSKSSFFEKKRKKSTFFNVLRLQAAITSQWFDENSLPSDLCTGYLFSIFTVEINSTSFSWPVHFVQETYPKVFLRRPTRLHSMPCHTLTV